MANFKKIFLTGDRPTGRLHLGHYVGSLQNRVKLQDEMDESFYMLANVQALTDNFKNPQKVRDSLIEVAIDNLSVGVDPTKAHFFIQSEIPEIAELTVFFMNLITIQQLSHNPIIKDEAKHRGFSLITRFDDDGNDENTDTTQGLPLGFFAYPVSQAADILFCKGTHVPVGKDQSPIVEGTREIARRFNTTYNTEVFPEPDTVLSETPRLVGTDGNAKASKSLGNAISLSDDADEVKKKVMSMYTDPDHVRVEDPGKVEGNVVFTYLDIFDDHTDEVVELKSQYQAGGLGDVVIKKRLIEVLNEFLDPIRAKRAEYESDPGAVMKIIEEGTRRAKAAAEDTMREVKQAMKLDYFS